MIMPELPPVMNTDMVSQLYAGVDAVMQKLLDSIEYEDKQWLFDSADEPGISRYESEMNIVPARTDTIESRRNAVAYKWNSFVPYTRRDLDNKLNNWCNGNYSRTITKVGKVYYLNLYVSFNQPNQADYIYRQLTVILPATFITNIQDISQEEHGTDYKLNTQNSQSMEG